MVAGIAAALAEQADTERVARLAVARRRQARAGRPQPSATIVAELAERVSLRPISTRETKHEQDLIAIEAGGGAVAGALCERGLRKAATERGWDCDIEIRNAAGMQQVMPAPRPSPAMSCC